MGPKPCLGCINYHQRCLECSDPDSEATFKISWLEGSISLCFQVRAIFQVSEIDGQKRKFHSKPILSYKKIAKQAAPNWI